MQDLIPFLNSHASIRHFTDQAISPEDEASIVSTAQRSPTSSNLQSYSVIAVRNPETKAHLAELSGKQDHIVACPLFLVFCADLFRLRHIAERRGYPTHCEYTEMFVVATVDTALIAGRALLAAQALGLGGVMVGAVRSNIEEVSTLLRLPDLVYPVMGMSLGYPSTHSTVKPRLPLYSVLFQEEYRTDLIDQGIEEYDEIIEQGGHLAGRPVQAEKYPDFKGTYTWSEHSARRIANTTPSTLRPHMKGFLEKRGFLLK